MSTVLMVKVALNITISLLSNKIG